MCCVRKGSGGGLLCFESFFFALCVDMPWSAVPICRNGDIPKGWKLYMSILLPRDCGNRTRFALGAFGRCRGVGSRINRGGEVNR